MTDEQEAKTCLACGKPWVAVQRGECSFCGSDAGPISAAGRRLLTYAMLGASLSTRPAGGDDRG